MYRCYCKSFHIFLKTSDNVEIFDLVLTRWACMPNTGCSNLPRGAYCNSSRKKLINIFLHSFQHMLALLLVC